MAKCGTVSLGAAAVAAVLVAVGLFSLYTGVTAVLAKREETQGGINDNMGAYSQLSPALMGPEGPLNIFVGKNGTDDCDAVFDSLVVTFVNNVCAPGTDSWCGTSPTFDLADFGDSVPAGGVMVLDKDCAPGSVGGVYSDVTAVATMAYTPVCETNCNRYTFFDYGNSVYKNTVAYNIESPLVGVFGIAMVLILETRKTVERAWETGGDDFTWFMIWAAVGCVVGGGACFMMEDDSSSDEATQEMA